MKTIAYTTLSAALTWVAACMLPPYASAQERPSPRVCTSPDYDAFVMRYDTRPGQPQPRGSTAADWREAFLQSVQRCAQGDALVITREAMTLAPRFCDLEKPFAFKPGAEDAALCTYAGGERKPR